MAVSPFDHPILSGLLGDQEIDGLLGAEAELAAIARFQTALVRASAETGLVPRSAAQAIEQALLDFAPDIEALKVQTASDGVIVPGYVKALRTHVGPPNDEFVHKGCTSQDVIDTALVLRLKVVGDLFGRRLSDLTTGLDGLSGRFGDRTLTGITRMQNALPLAAASRIASWRAPLVRHRARLAEMSGRVFRLQLGGAVGTREEFEGRGNAVSAAMARELGLADAAPWHGQRDGIIEFADWLAQISGSLGKFGADIGLMALDGRAIALSGGGGSSAMPHKSNPVAAEVLVALARHNAGLAGTMNHSLVHELERSGAAWTLEWLTLPAMIVTTGSALLRAEELLGRITNFGEDGNARTAT